MERGFDQLMTPTGIYLVTFAAFLVMLFIVFGAVFSRLEQKRRREARQRKVGKE